MESCKLAAVLLPLKLVLLECNSAGVAVAIDGAVDREGDAMQVAKAWIGARAG